jgi:hypothetical protein
MRCKLGRFWQKAGAVVCKYHMHDRGGERSECSNFKIIKVQLSDCIAHYEAISNDSHRHIYHPKGNRSTVVVYSGARLPVRLPARLPDLLGLHVDL